MLSWCKYGPRTVICMDNKYCEHSSWPESVAGAESAAEGAVWNFGCWAAWAARLWILAVAVGLR